MNAVYAEKFQQCKALHESEGEDGYNLPWATKANSAKLGFKKNIIKFSDLVEQTKYDKK